MIWVAFACGAFLGFIGGLFTLAAFLSGKREPTTIRETRDQ